MTDTLETIASLNWAYILGRTAAARDYPPDACPRLFDKAHTAEWNRGYREQANER